jgi:predicted flavoprotein YhiN
MPSFTDLEVNHVLSNMLNHFERGTPTQQNVQQMPVLDAIKQYTVKQAGGELFETPIVNRGGVTLEGFDSDEDDATFVIAGLPNPEAYEPREVEVEDD